MSAPYRMQRRDFLKAMGAGGLLLAIGNAAIADAAVAAPKASALAGWVRIAPDGAVTLLSNTSEIGQGTGTALAQILANELDLDWAAIRIAMAPIEPAYFNPTWGEYATYGSGGVSGQFAPLRKAGAQARAVLLAAAAAHWKVSPDECDSDAGTIIHRASRRRLGYGQLAAVAASLPVPAEPPLMPRERWRFIGADTPRVDLPAKVDGSASFGIDVKLPGLLIATIAQSPKFGSRLAQLDPAPALAMRGVRKVVRMDNAVAVIADSYWTAKKGLDALKPVWDDSQAGGHTSAAYDASLAEAANAGGTVYAAPDSSVEKVKAAYDEAMGKASHSMSAVYTVPFLHHATMEPMNATARIEAGLAELWLPTQTQTTTRAAVAKELGIPAEAVTIHTTLSGGGFGRRIEFDFALQAVRIAASVPGKPVKLIWSREEDMRHGFYRPSAALKLSAGIGSNHLPLALRFDTACESLLAYSRAGEFKDEARPVDKVALGATPRFYQIPAFMLSTTTIDAGVPVGFWRSVAASQNTFAHESFIDELAHRAGLDPLDYRRRLLLADGRERRTLDAAIARSGWNTPAKAGRHRGMAMVRANGSVIAHVVELSVADGTKVRIHRITTAVDCGIAVNPRNVRAQIEGGIAFGLSAAFHGEITIRDGAVEQSNFHDYRLIGMADMPPVDLIMIESNDKPGGVGEEAVGPLAPAVANALFAATGKRIRALPLAKAGFVFA